MEETATNFDEFFSAMGDDGFDEGNQTDTDTAESSQEEGSQQETEESVVAEQEAAPAAEGAAVEGAGTENPNENTQEPPQEQKFTLKWNSTTKEVGINEMTELAQKGMDYDRVKGQLTSLRENHESLQKTLNEQSSVVESLKAAAEDSGMTVDQLIDSIQVGIMQGRGMTEAEARAEIRANRAERKLRSMEKSPAEPETMQKQEETARSTDIQERARRELAEFRDAYPNVQLTDEIVGKLAADTNKGMSLLNAYQKLEISRLNAELQTQKAKAAAEAKNQKNRLTAAPGQSDSGGGREKDAFDDFFSSYEK